MVGAPLRINSGSRLGPSAHWDAVYKAMRRRE
jgi:hypothetical protein